MNRKIKILLVAVAVIILIAVAYLFREYNRTPTNVADITAAETISAPDLIAAFENNETLANEKFTGKIIEVTGVISSIHNEADTVVSVRMETGDPLHKINCALAKNEMAEIKNYATGQSIAIKGYCTGYLLDVELNRCVIKK